MGDLPRAGEGNEVYLFPTVTTPPTSASVEYGIEPGIPRPAASNRTNAHLGISGTLREENKHLLPLTITVQGAAAVKQGIQQLVDRALVSTDANITDIVRQIRRHISAPAGGAPVPRFSVTRADSLVPLGIDPDFAGTPLATLSPPSGYGTVVNVGAATGASLCLDYRGRLICAYLVERTTAGGDQGKHRILASVYDQADGNGWTDAVTPTEWGSDWILNNGVILNTPSLAMVLYRGDIYALVVDAGTIANQARGYLHVYRLRQSTTSPPWSFEAVGDPVQLGTASGVIANGGVSAAALPDRVVVAVGAYSGPNISFREVTRTIWVGQSTDMVNWSENDDNSSGFVALDAFRDALPVGADGARTTEKVNRVRMYLRKVGGSLYGHVDGDDQHGWAVTESGRIYGTEDGGVTWSQQTSPVTVPLYDIMPVSGSGDGITVYAVGASGCILKTTDSGRTWKILTIARGQGDAIEAEKFVNTSEKHRPTIGDGPLYGCAWITASEGWVVGENKISYTTNAGESWRKLEPSETRATYTCIGIINPVAKSIIVGGNIQRERSKTTASIASNLKRWRFLKFVNGASNAYTDANLQFHDIATSDAYRIEALFVRSPTEAYAVGRGGTLLKTTNLNASPPTWTDLSGQVPGSRDLVDIQWRKGADEGHNEFLLVSSDGVLFRSVTDAGEWVLQHIGTESAARSISFVTYDIEDEAESVVLAGCGTGLWRANLGAQLEALPSLLALSSGELLLATANLQSGRIDLRRSTDRGMTFARVDLSDSEVVTFTPQTSFTSLDSTTLQPSLCKTDAGEIVLTAGSGGVVAQDGVGHRWVARDSRELALPLGMLSITNAATQNRTRQTIAYGGGRLFTVSMNSSFNYETRTAREYSGTSPIYNPVIPSVAQWLGVDDMRVVFPTTNLPTGEEWTISPEYRFPARHLVSETRDQFWRGGTNLFVPAEFIWDRQHADTVAILGAGAQWNMTAAAVFGYGVRTAFLDITTPDYNSASFPTDDTKFTRFLLRADVEEGLVAVAPDGSASGSPYNVIRCGGKEWLPSQWKPGCRSYYVEIHTGSWVLAYPILDNTVDSLIIQRGDNATAIPAGSVFFVVGDRMWCSGEGGTRGGLDSRPPLVHSPYEFGRLIRLVVPPQSSPVGYWRLDGVVIGRHVPVTIRRPEGVFERDRFDRNWRWRVTQSSAEEASLHGSTAVETFGRPRKHWQLAYSAVHWFDRDSTLGPLIPQMKRGFALLFDDRDPHSVEWVRLTSDVDVVHGGEDLYGHEVTISEI